MKINHKFNSILSNLLLVASGGALGAAGRYLISYVFKFFLFNNFYATLCVNIFGSFLIGYIISLGFSKNVSYNFIKYFLIIGFLGSFTTFSTFSNEVVDMYLENKIFLSIIYIIFSVTLCITATFLGISINKF